MTFSPVRKGKKNNVGRHDFATREVVGRGGEMEVFALTLYRCAMEDSI